LAAKIPGAGPAARPFAAVATGLLALWTAVCLLCSFTAPEIVDLPTGTTDHRLVLPLPDGLTLVAQESGFGLRSSIGWKRIWRGRVGSVARTAPG
jgi:hypothetical protein